MSKPKLQFKAPAYNTELLLKHNAQSADIKLALWAIAAIVAIVLIVLFTRPSMTGKYSVEPLCMQGELAVESTNDAHNLQQYQGFKCRTSLIPAIKCCAPPNR